jgi:hypothetical protein
MDTAGGDNLQKQWLQRGVLLRLCGGSPADAGVEQHHRKEAGPPERKRAPAEALLIGLPVMAGDFPVFITRATGSNGRFSVEGYVGIPYLSNAQVAVTFENVFVNSDQSLVDGGVVKRKKNKNKHETNNNPVSIKIFRKKPFKSL